MRHFIYVEKDGGALHYRIKGERLELFDPQSVTWELSCYENIKEIKEELKDDPTRKIIEVFRERS